MSGTALTPERVARAIVAAARLLNRDPAAAFDAGQGGGYGVRVLAAHGVRARLGVRPADLGKVFRIHPVDITPSSAAKRGFTTDQLLAIAEALGPVQETPEEAHTRFIAPLKPVDAEVGVTRPKPVRAGDRPCPTPPARASTYTSGPRSSALTGPPDPTRADAGPVSRPIRRSAASLRAIPGLKPVTPDIARRATGFLEANWALATVADLFEVCPVALLDALDPLSAREAA